MWQKAAADKGHKYIHQTQTETFLQGKEGLLGILFICQVPVLNRYFLLSCTFFRKRFPGGNCSLSVTVASYMWALKHSYMKFSQRISANLGFPQLNRATGCDAWGMKFSEGETLLCRDNRRLLCSQTGSCTLEKDKQIQGRPQDEHRLYRICSVIYSKEMATEGLKS